MKKWYVVKEESGEVKLLDLPDGLVIPATGRINIGWERSPTLEILAICTKEENELFTYLEGWGPAGMLENFQNLISRLGRL